MPTFVDCTLKNEMWKLDRETVHANQIYKEMHCMKCISCVRWKIQLGIHNFITLTTFLYQMSSTSLWITLNTLTMRIMLGLILAMEHAPKHRHRSSWVQEGYACSISSEEASLNHFQWTLGSHCNWSQGFLNIRHPSGDVRGSGVMPLSLPYETLHGKQGIHILHTEATRLLYKMLLI